MKVLILTHIDVNTIMLLQQQHAVSIVIGGNNNNLSDYLHDCEILIYRNQVELSAEFLADAPNLKLILRLQIDQDDVDHDYLAANHIEFVHIPRPTARAVAELTFGLMLGLARKVRCMDHRTRTGQKIPVDARGVTLEGKTLGIIGAGKIGRTTGELGRLWGMTVIGCVEDPTEDKALRLREHGITLKPLEDVMRSADFVTVHVPYKSGTHHLIGDEELALMKSNSFLLNMGDGGVVDEYALHEALVDKRLAGAALDAHEKSDRCHRSPLIHLNNVILTPRIGAFTIDTRRTVGKRIVQAISEASE